MNPAREVTTFPISSTIKSKLVQAGFRTVEDFKGLRPAQLSKEVNISLNDALEVINTVSGKTVGATATTKDTQEQNDEVKGFSALEILKKQQNRNSIMTFCMEMDMMLAGGISLGAVTEFCGVPGIGKTQLGIQLAIDVQIPQSLGGLEGQAIYIDTEGSYMVERVEQVAQALIDHLQQKTNEIPAETIQHLTLENMLSNIYYYRVHDFIEQLSLINVLPSFLREHPQVKIIIVDSITFHFRHDFEDYAMRSRLLHGMAQNLSQMADAFEVAVVLINQVTTKITSSESYLAPALGESWNHACTHRVILYFKEGVRHAMLYKSPSMPVRDVPYLITSQGVRDYNKKKRTRDSVSQNENN